MDKKNKNPNVPNLRFNNVPYKKYNLDEFATRVTRKNKDNISSLPLTISAQYGLVDQVSFFNKTVASKDMSGYYLLKNGEFAYNKSYSNDYPWGAIKRLDLYDMGCLSTLYICFKPNDGIVNSNYLVHYFESPKWHKQVADIAGEGARNHGLLNIAVNDFFNTKHAIPIIENQIKIAKFLDLIEDRIQTQIKIINSLESQIRTINNNIASDSTSSELSIGSLFHVKTSNKLVESNTGKFCIVDMGTIDANGNYIIGKYTDDETSLISYGTLVMPKDDIGGGKIICKTMYINASNKYALSDHVFALNLKNDSYNPIYFSALINSQYNNHRLKKLVTGSAQLGINQENLNRYKLKFSDSLQLQHKYSELIVRLNEKLIIEKRLLDLFSSQKKYLLKNMFV